MLQSLRKDLEKYHELFGGGRCSSWQLEELMVKAVKSDTRVHHHVIWTEAGHDSKADIKIRTNENNYNIQIKSGQIKAGELILSGYRLGRFKGELAGITEYLNHINTNTIAVPYMSRESDEKGKTHIYELLYVHANHLSGLDAGRWKKPGDSYQQTNLHGLTFTLSPSMSWQIWWKIPLTLTERTKPFEIN